MSKTLKIILAIFGIGIIGIIIFFIVAFNSFASDMCGTKLVESKVSPNGKLKILVFSVNCGAISDFSTQISIVDSDYILKNDDVGNIFSADSDHGKAKMNKDREIIELKTRWINNNSLEIEYTENARIFKNNDERNDVQIIYKQMKD
ncbi:DUF5412 family protein [Epilithonimonas pallida]|uniref:Uncharacterized protein n=1 Tax=Epilithonimonas pallida TaxID=373671 RepID=A0ABY1R550_9FLAO|nr:DUF5412 family protein [Epilithonimonas pallida]SMP93333.1 hypothetical protein SAMN05421679_104410 [Epilithonimonas pallida]